MPKRRTDRDSRGVSRRHFVSSTAAAAFAGAFGAPRLFAAATAPEVPLESVLGGRAAEAYSVRIAAADLARKLPCEGHRGNGDETRYATKWASYTKALPHDALGHVVPDAYAAYLAAMRSGNAEEMEKIPLGGFTKLSNPHAALAFDLIGPDAAQPVLAAPARMDSAERAAELVELYWHALLRDVRFADYESSPLVQRACDELTSLRTFSGPRAGGKVTPATLFRGHTRGGSTGPYVSQFLLRDIPFGSTRFASAATVEPPMAAMSLTAAWNDRAPTSSSDNHRRRK